METPRQVIERAAYAAIGYVDCDPKNAPTASKVIANFVMGELRNAGFVISPESQWDQATR